MNNFELKDFDYKVSKRHAAERKIKFKNVSFLNFTNRFKNFLQKRLEKKLEKATNDAMNSKFNKFEMETTIDGKTIADRIMKSRTEKVAKIEEKLIILGRGKIEKRNYINTRAIKLKEEMMKYVRKTGRDIYSIPEEIKENMLNGTEKKEINDTKRVIDEETIKLQDNLKNIETNVNEEEITAVINQSLNNISLENDINVAETKQSVDKVFDEKEMEDSNYSLSDESAISPIKNIKPMEFPAFSPVSVIEKKLSEVDLNSDVFGNSPKIDSIPVTSEENNVEIESEEIEREMPIIAEERKINYYEKTKDDIKKYDSLMDELKDTKINDIETAERIRNELEKTENEIIENKNNLSEEEALMLEKEFEENKQEEIKEETSENISFDYSEATARDIDKAISVTKSPKDLKAMMERVRLLQEEEKRTQERAEQAEKQKKAKEQEFEETARKLQAYGDDLEQKCTINAEKEKQTLEEAKEWDQAINSMLQAMNSSSNIKDNNIKKK